MKPEAKPLKLFPLTADLETPTAWAINGHVDWGYALAALRDLIGVEAYVALPGVLVASGYVQIKDDGQFSYVSGPAEGHVPMTVLTVAEPAS